MVHGRAIWLVAACVTTMSCTTQFPMKPGFDLVLEPVMDPLEVGSCESKKTLQITWFGTGCYLIQLDDGAVLTDPFVSHHGLAYSVFEGTLESDVKKVKDTFGPLQVPQAMFIAHAHWDHLMDVAPALSQGGWQKTPVYGSLTVSNILDGYDGNLERNWREAKTDQDWIEIPSGNSETTIEYKAFEAKHAPQALGVLLYSGKVETPRTTPPTRASHFQMGRPYSFLFRLTRCGKQFTVFVMTSASDWEFGAPPVTETPVDVAILCVPGKAKGYPQKFIERLQARYVVLSHFDDFFQDGGASPKTIRNGDFYGFLRTVQCASNYDRLERIVAPNVGSTLRIKAE